MTSPHLHHAVEPAVYLRLEHEMGPFYVGATVKLLLEFQNTESGALEDPATLKLTTRAPDGSTTTYTHGADAVISRRELGKFSGAIVPNLPGPWEYWWESTATTGNGAGKGTFDVEPLGP